MAGNRNSKPRIDSVWPPAAIPGGQLEVCGSGMAKRSGEQPEVRLGGVAGRIIVCSEQRLVVKVPEDASNGDVAIRAGDARSQPSQFSLGKLLADDMHPVANPAIDSHGNVFTTQSGPRGKKTPVSIFKITRGGDVTAFLSGIVNPTGLLFQPNGTLLISSRHNGTVYGVTPDGQMDVFAEGMGVATGLAIDPEENVYVGDRTGTVFKISRDRNIYVFATLEPSVAAYHMASGQDGNLYVAAPTTSSFDAIHRIDPKGTVTVWRRGFGRPQGLAFDSANRLHLCASYRGQRGIFRVLEDGTVEQVVSGPGIVGLAFTHEHDIVAVTGNSVYHIGNPG